MKRGIDKKGKILEEKRTLKCTGQADEKVRTIALTIAG